MRIKAVARGSALLLAASILLGASRLGEPVAVLVSASGQVSVQRGTAKPLAGSVGLSLEAGDRVTVAGGGKAVVMYKTGKVETVTTSLSVTEPEKKDPGGLYTQTARRIAQVATVDANRQPNRQGMIRPVQGQAAPIAPRNNVRVLDVRPTFSWFSLPGTAEYVVQLRRTDLPGARPMRFSVGKDTTWTLPRTAPPLVPGAAYEWTVGPAAGGRVGQVQPFRVITAEQFTQLAGVLQELSAAGVDPATDGLFVLALAYRDAGLYYEAEAALARLEAAGAGNGRVYHLMRAEVMDALGDLEGAAREFGAADREGTQ